MGILDKAVSLLHSDEVEVIEEGRTLVGILSSVFVG